MSMSKCARIDFNSSSTTTVALSMCTKEARPTTLMCADPRFQHDVVFCEQLLPVRPSGTKCRSTR